MIGQSQGIEEINVQRLKDVGHVGRKGQTDDVSIPACLQERDLDMCVVAIKQEETSGTGSPGFGIRVRTNRLAIGVLETR